MTANPHSTAPGSRVVANRATGHAATTSAVVVEAVVGKVMAKVARAGLATTAHAKKAAPAVVVGKAKAADKVAQAVNPTRCAPALTPWASAVGTAAVEAVAVMAEVANPVEAVGALTRCAPTLAASNNAGLKPPANKRWGALSAPSGWFARFVEQLAQHVDGQRQNNGAGPVTGHLRHGLQVSQLHGLGPLRQRFGGF